MQISSRPFPIGLCPRQCWEGYFAVPEPGFDVFHLLDELSARGWGGGSHSNSDAPSQLPYGVRKHLEKRQSLSGKTAACESYNPPRPQLFPDCGNRILPKCGRGPILHHVVLFRLKNVNAANQPSAQGIRLRFDQLTVQHCFRTTQTDHSVVARTRFTRRLEHFSIFPLATHTGAPRAIGHCRRR
jgi:hypothetical protein